MDKQAHAILRDRLPEDPISEINSHLIILYSKENAKICANLIKAGIKSGEPYTYSIHSEEFGYFYYDCGCGEIISMKYDKNSTLRQMTHVNCPAWTQYVAKYAERRKWHSLGNRLTTVRFGKRL